MTGTLRANVLRTAKKLLAMTTKRGCTQAESASAHRALAQLMREHGLTLGEVKSGKRHRASIAMPTSSIYLRP